MVITDLAQRNRWSLPVINAALLLAAGLLVFVVLALAEFHGLERTLALTTTRAALRENVVAIVSVLSDVKDVELGQRGYLITGEERYLEPYVAAMDHLQASFDRLQAAVEAVLPQPPGTWERIREVLDRRLRIATENLELRRLGRFDARRDMGRLEVGRVAMDELRREFAGLEMRHRQRMAALDRERDAVREQAIVAGIGVGVLGFLMAAGGLVALLREQRRRQAAEAQLATINDGLEREIAARVEQLRQAAERAQAFAATLDATVEDERRRLAREVHDQIGQFFTAMKLLARTWEPRFPDDPTMRDQLRAFMGLVDEGIAAARRISAELRPPMLDDMGLAAALQHYATRAIVPAGLACEVTLAHHGALAADQANALFRIAQEALTNTLRHAGARRSWITDAREDGHYVFRIADDGLGPAPGMQPGTGLHGMQERALLAGGTLEMGENAGGGTLVRVRLPLLPPPSPENPA